MKSNSYLKIKEHYSQCFEKHGDTPKGLDWDNQDNMNKRYKVMYELLRDDWDNNLTLLDFGCGYGGFYNWLNKNILNHGVSYCGVDINQNLIDKAKELNPKINLFQDDIQSYIYDNNKFSPFDMNWDWIICNGTFTVKANLTQEEMTNFMCSTLEKLWEKTNKGIAFNIMSLNVDWQRDDLFHVSMDQLGRWITDNLSRNFTFRHDYSLYEYTTYVYK